MRNSIIHVTAFDIERGRRGHSYQPIARAVWQRTKNGTLVMLMHEEELLISNAGERCWCRLPPDAVAFTEAFNRHMPVNPISFKIAIPKTLLRKRSEGKRDTTAFPFFDPPQSNETVDYRT